MLYKTITMSEKVTRSYEDLMILVRALNIILSNKDIAASKAGKKLEKIAKKAQPFLEQYNEKLEDLRLEHANVDENGSLLTDEKGGYKYSKEGTKALNAAVKALLKSEFDFYKLSFSAEGLEDYTFLHKWVDGISEPVVEEEEAE